jgi:hypothetical protein
MLNEGVVAYFEILLCPGGTEENNENYRVIKYYAA